MTIMEKPLKTSLIMQFCMLCFLWGCLIIPSFLTYGKIHFVLPVIYLWVLALPQRLPVLSLLTGGVIQDILLDFIPGTHSLFYSLFMGIVFSQRPLLYKCSFIFKWTIFGCITFIIGCIFFLLLYHHSTIYSFLEITFYHTLIPWLLFPIFSHTLSKYLTALATHHGS